MSKIVLVAGGSGSGKTELCKKVIEGFEKEVIQLSIDNYYKDASDLSIEDRLKINWDDPSTIDWELFINDVSQLKDGHAIDVPVYDYVSCKRLGSNRVEPRKWIVIEGIFALTNDKLNEMAHLRVYVQTDADVRLIRRIRRDVFENEISIKHVINKWEHNVMPAYRKIVSPTTQEAHIIINNSNNGFNDPAIQTLINSFKGEE